MSDFDLQYWKKLDTQIPGWMSQEEAEFYVENIKPGRYLEIGVAFGKSFSLLKHHFPETNATGIDLINHGIDGDIWLGNANEMYQEVPDNSIDTLFIDGDHTREGCLKDFVHWFNKVKVGGVVIFHDYGRNTAEHKGVKEVVDFIKPLLKDFKKANCISCGTKYQ